MLTNLKKNYLFNLSALLLCLMPMALIAGPLIAEIFIIIIILNFIFFVVKNKEYQIFDKPIIKFFFFFYILIAINSFFSEDIFFSLKNSLFYFRFIFFALAVAFLLKFKSNLKLQFFNFLTFILLLVCFDSVIQILFGINILGLSPNSNIRISSFFYDELVLGSFLQKILPIYLSLYFFFNFKEKKKLFVIFFTTIFVFTIIFRSGERTAFYLILLYFFILLTLISNLPIKKKYILPIMIFLITIVSFQNPNIYKRIFIDTYNQVTGNFPYLVFSSRTDDKEDQYIIDNKKNNQIVFFSSMHDNHIRSAYSMFKDKMIFGHGVKMFRIICKKEKYFKNRESCSTHPHNTYAQLLAETGLVGFFMFFGLFIVISLLLLKIFINKFIFKKITKISNYELCLLISFFITLWPLIPSGNFFNNWINILYFFPLGFYLEEKIKFSIKINETIK